MNRRNFLGRFAGMFTSLTCAPVVAKVVEVVPGPSWPEKPLVLVKDEIWENLSIQRMMDEGFDSFERICTGPASFAYRVSKYQ